MSSKIELNQITIAALYWEAVASCRRLFNFFGESPESPTSLADDFGRLKVWAENVGAHRHGTTLSLDHRVREVSSLKEMAKDLLMDLNTILEESE